MNSLDSYQGFTPQMYPSSAKFTQTKVVFHADLEKLLDFWRFDHLCLQSFKDPFEKTAAMNPKEREIEIEPGVISKLFPVFSTKKPITYEITPEQLRIKSETFTGDEYKESECYSTNFEWLYRIKGSYATYMTMPTVYYETKENFDEFEIQVLNDGNQRVTIEKSKHKIAIDDGRHRTRFLEFIGSKDIYIAVERKDLWWFQANCKYIGGVVG